MIEQSSGRITQMVNHIAFHGQECKSTAAVAELQQRRAGTNHALMYDSPLHGVPGEGAKLYISCTEFCSFEVAIWTADASMTLPTWVIVTPKVTLITSQCWILSYAYGERLRRRRCIMHADEGASWTASTNPKP